MGNDGTGGFVVSVRYTKETTDVHYSGVSSKAVCIECIFIDTPMLRIVPSIDQSIQNKMTEWCFTIHDYAQFMVHKSGMIFRCSLISSKIKLSIYLHRSA